MIQPNLVIAIGAYQPITRIKKTKSVPGACLSGATANSPIGKQVMSALIGNGSLNKSPFTYERHSMTGGVGLLAAEAPKYLAFMNQFWVFTPYGGDRELLPVIHDQGHYGSLPGTASWVAQLIDGTLEYKQFANLPNGTWSFDPAKATSKSCSVPRDVDIFFAMNQRNDAKCTNHNECVFEVGNDAKSAYSDGYYDSVIKEALCKVPWNL